MNELLSLALNQRKIKETLNVIFVGSIASYIFERIFFKYYVLDITDFKSILSFFIKGEFLIPFIIFYLVWTFTIALRLLLFQVPNFFITNRFGDWITKFLIDYYNGNTIFNIQKSKMPKSKSLKHMIKSFPETEIEDHKLIRRTIQSHKKLESDFTLIFRGFIAITIYFISLDYFGWITYSICILILLYMWVIQIVNYQLAEVTPDVINSNKELEDSHAIIGGGKEIDR